MFNPVLTFGWLVVGLRRKMVGKFAVKMEIVLWLDSGLGGFPFSVSIFFLDCSFILCLHFCNGFLVLIFC